MHSTNTMKENTHATRTDKERYEKKQQYYEKNKDYIIEKSKMYYEENKDYVLEKRKQHYAEHKDVINESHKKYNEANKELLSKRRLQSINCECGYSYTLCNKARHEKTQLHQLYLQSLENN